MQAVMVAAVPHCIAPAMKKAGKSMIHETSIDPPAPPRCAISVGNWEAVAILGFVAFLFFANAFILYYDMGITTTPICESEFYEAFADENYHRWPKCFANNGAPWEGADLNGVFQFPWRGLWEVLLGIIVAILIDVVYSVHQPTSAHQPGGKCGLTW